MADSKEQTSEAVQNQMEK